MTGKSNIVDKGQNYYKTLQRHPLSAEQEIFIQQIKKIAAHIKADMNTSGKVTHTLAGKSVNNVNKSNGENVNSEGEKANKKGENVNSQYNTSSKANKLKQKPTPVPKLLKQEVKKILKNTPEEYIPSTWEKNCANQNYRMIPDHRLTQAKTVGSLGKKNSKLFKVRVKIGGKPFAALIDSGAEVCVGSPKLVQHLKKNVDKINTKILPHLELKSVDDNYIPSLSRTEFQNVLSFHEDMTPESLIVNEISTPPEVLVIPLDLLEKFNARLFFFASRPNELAITATNVNTGQPDDFLVEALPEVAHVLHVAQTVTLMPNYGSKVTIEIPQKQNEKVTLTEPFKKHLTILEDEIKLTGQDKTCIQVLNTSNEPICLWRNEELVAAVPNKAIAKTTWENDENENELCDLLQAGQQEKDTAHVAGLTSQAKPFSELLNMISYGKYASDDYEKDNIDPKLAGIDPSGENRGVKTRLLDILT